MGVEVMRFPELPIIADFGGSLRSADGSPAPPLSAWEFLNFKSGLQVAIAYSSLFWPEFIVHDGLVFLSHKFSIDSFDRAIANGLSASASQASLNHVHVWDLFTFCDEQFSQPFANYLAQVLQASWAAKLASDFPMLGVTVALVDGGYGPELIVRQDHSPGSSRGTE
jgi:hypothetical protein